MWYSVVQRDTVWWILSAHLSVKLLCAPPPVVRLIHVTRFGGQECERGGWWRGWWRWGGGGGGRKWESACGVEGWGALSYGHRTGASRGLGSMKGGRARDSGRNLDRRWGCRWCIDPSTVKNFFLFLFCCCLFFFFHSFFFLRCHSFLLTFLDSFSFFLKSAKSHIIFLP
jgi:hypothetical protein